MRRSAFDPRGIIVLCLALPALAQNHPADDNPYSRKNTFAVFAEYSNDSSHIILGYAPNRKLTGIGVQYERRLFENRNVRWSYDAEFRPFIVSSDVAATQSLTVLINGVTTVYGSTAGTVESCAPGTTISTLAPPIVTTPETFTITIACTRQSTLAQGGSPLGIHLNILPRRPLQLTLSSDAGYMYSTKPIPIPDAGSFNFTFNFGGGLEYFYKPHRSLRLEYLVQHYSNKNTANENPGVDSGFIRFTYAFGH